MFVIKQGLVNHKQIVQKIFSNLEHGELTGVSGLILHRTDSPTVTSTLNAYADPTKTTGAHFLIGKDGVVYQTAHLDQKCWHAGTMRARCVNEDDCESGDLERINGFLYQKGASWGKKFRDVSRYEASKPYPARYPNNTDSLGIEVVGAFNSLTKQYEAPTLLQLQRLKWLVINLLSIYGMSMGADVYAHGSIARKQPQEGQQLLNGLVK